MTLHDPSARTPRPGAARGGGWRDRHRLAVIERRLTADSPQLRAMFAMFNRLSGGERPADTERLPPPARPRPVHLALLLALAAVAGLCFVLSLQVQSAMPPCPAGTGAPASSAGAASAAVSAADCSAYPTSK